MMNCQTQQTELRITNVLRRAVYRKSCQLIKDGWHKKSEIKTTVISDSSKKYYVYSQDFIK